MKNARKQRILKKLLIESTYPCQHKIKYKGRKSAIEGQHKEAEKRNKELFVYKCNYCKYFHLTSSKPR